MLLYLVLKLEVDFFYLFLVSWIAFFCTPVPPSHPKLLHLSLSHSTPSTRGWLILLFFRPSSSSFRVIAVWRCVPLFYVWIGYFHTYNRALPHTNYPDIEARNVLYKCIEMYFVIGYLLYDGIFFSLLNSLLFTWDAELKRESKTRELSGKYAGGDEDHHQSIWIEHWEKIPRLIIQFIWNFSFNLLVVHV